MEHIEKTYFVDRPAGSHANSQINLFRLDPENNTASQKLVQLGRASISQIEIVKGLAVGDQIIISDTSFFQEHLKIKIN